MINGLVMLYSVFFSNFGIAVIAFTLIVRMIMIPLSVKQSRQIKSMGALQPLMKEIQAKHKNDKQRASQETMRLYKDHGVNPLGCLGPMFIQFPIWIGLYQAILQTVPSNPESLVGLSRHLYGWLPQVHKVVPIDSSFLWLDLAKPDPSPFIMPILVGGSMFVMQKMSSMPAADGPAGIDKSYDVVDDAADVRFLHAEFPERTGSVLGGFKRDWGGDSGVHHWLGPAEEPVRLRARRRSGEYGQHDAFAGFAHRGDGNQ